MRSVSPPAALSPDSPLPTTAWFATTSHSLIRHDQSLADSPRHSFPCYSCDGRASGGGWYAALPPRVGVMGGLRCSIARQRSGGVFASAGFHTCRALSVVQQASQLHFPLGVQ